MWALCEPLDFSSLLRGFLSKAMSPTGVLCLKVGDRKWGVLRGFLLLIALFDFHICSSFRGDLDRQVMSRTGVVGAQRVPMMDVGTDRTWDERKWILTTDWLWGRTVCESEPVDTTSKCEYFLFFVS